MQEWQSFDFAFSTSQQFAISSRRFFIIINYIKQNPPCVYIIVSFFENRFENTPKNEWSTYWRTILKWAGWIINNIGFDKIAITEIVHCKSQKEFGVYENQHKIQHMFQYPHF